MCKYTGARVGVYDVDVRAFCVLNLFFLSHSLNLRIATKRLGRNPDGNTSGDVYKRRADFQQIDLCMYIIAVYSHTSRNIYVFYSYIYRFGQNETWPTPMPPIQWQMTLSRIYTQYNMFIYIYIHIVVRRWRHRGLLILLQFGPFVRHKRRRFI